MTSGLFGKRLETPTPTQDNRRVPGISATRATLRKDRSMASKFVGHGTDAEKYGGSKTKATKAPAKGKGKGC